MPSNPDHFKLTHLITTWPGFGIAEKVFCDTDSDTKFVSIKGWGAGLLFIKLIG